MSIERRKHPRRAVRQPVTIVQKDGAIIAPCTMLDVSAGGARLKLDAPTSVPNEFILQLSEFGPRLIRRCLIAWRDERQMGVRFLNA